MNGNYSNSPKEESATGRPPRDHLSVRLKTARPSLVVHGSAPGGGSRAAPRSRSRVDGRTVMAASEDTWIVADAIGKAYGSTEALQALRFTIRAGTQ